MELTLGTTPEQKIKTGVIMAKVMMAAALTFIFGSFVVKSAAGYPLWIANVTAGIGVIFLVLFVIFWHIVRRSRADLNTQATFHSGGQ